MKVLWTITFAVACAALLPLVAAAKPAIPDPFTARPCASPDDVILDLSAPAGLYVNAGAQCPAVCHRAEKLCERYVKQATTCQRQSIQDEVAYAKLSCNMTLSGPPKKTCLEQAGSDGDAARQLIDMDQTADIGLCQNWGGACVFGCP
jgi:hypothetical protein